jgi:nucleoredoxin
MNPLRQMLDGAPLQDATGKPVEVRTLFEQADGSPLPKPEKVAPTEAHAEGAPPAADPSDRYVMLYFSAHWCPPCRGFTPVLSETYKQLKSQGKDVEVIFCSLDRTPQEFLSYAQTMPWMRLPFGDSRIQNASSTVGAMFIPTLAIFRASDGQMISQNAVRSVQGDRSLANYPWPGSASSPQQAIVRTVVRCFAVIVVLVMAAKYFGFA